MLNKLNFLKVTLLLFSFIFINSCKKEPLPPVVLSFTGKIINGRTMQPISNFPVRLDFRPNIGFGFSLFDYDDIANCVTNGNGEFTLTTSQKYSKDSTDCYRIRPARIEEYFEVEKEINAQKSEILKDNSVGEIQVYERIFAKFNVEHIGQANADDQIQILIDGLAGKSLNYDIKGAESLYQFNYGVVPNSPTIISRRGIKNNVPFGPFSDTIIFTNVNNSYYTSY